MRYAFAIGLLLALCGCATIAGMLGFVPTEEVDGGPATSLGIEAATAASGAFTVLVVVAQNLYRNHTRAKALRAKLDAEARAAGAVPA
jgi:hypothetical protein